ncbi:MAG TPA: 2-oxoacid:acceptor oxidoreductase family protein [Desulfohalobiaceae bacterium]|nr:2-oxoacid:acceptor oxidoreductase family protein [Desulfohalobiaceae bacterium]
MKEIRFHGRGGQGAVLGAEMFAQALVIEGQYASSIPSFGAERRGAPVTVSLRIDKQFIRDTHQIYEPECVIILDPSLAQSSTCFRGLTGDGIVIVNTSKDLTPTYQQYENVSIVGLLDASSIALAVIGKSISNTCMLGAIAKVTGWVSLDSIKKSLEMYFSGKLLEKNIKSTEEGYTQIKSFCLKNQ